MFDVKGPGDPLTLHTLPLKFNYQDSFQSLPDAYETLLVDAFIGDQNLICSCR